MKTTGKMILAVLLSIFMTVSVWADMPGVSPDYATDYYMIVESPDGGIDIYPEPNLEAQKLNSQMIPNGTALHIEGEYQDEGRVWGYTQYHNMYGYVPLDDCRPATRTEAIESELYLAGSENVDYNADYQVTVDGEGREVYLYNGPGKKYGAVSGVGEIPDGTQLQIMEEANLSDNGGSWGYTSYGGAEGWIDLTVTEEWEDKVKAAEPAAAALESEAEPAAAALESGTMSAAVPAANLTSTPTPKPTATPTPKPTATSTPTPKPTATPTPKPTATSTPTPKPTATSTPTPKPTATSTPTPKPTATSTPTPEPTATSTPTPEPTATSTPTPEPTSTSTPTPEPTATAEPTVTPTTEAAETPTPETTATNKSAAAATDAPETEEASSDAAAGFPVYNPLLWIGGIGILAIILLLIYHFRHK